MQNVDAVVAQLRAAYLDAVFGNGLIALGVVALTVLVCLVSWIARPVKL